MRYFILLFLISLVNFESCKTPTPASEIYTSSTLKIRQLSKSTFQHISYLQTTSFGNVPCNGMVFIDKKEAIIFDTPATNDVSLELIRWIETQQKAQIKAVVINHFHVDCLGGLQAFHDKKIESYANNLTIELAKKETVVVPKNGFDGQMELMIGAKKIINQYFGKGHTFDNIVSYVPSEKTLFGGCLIKSMNAGKGNLNDASVIDWSETVEKVKQAFPNVKTVIPGHGKVGDVELLDFTMELFE